MATKFQARFLTWSVIALNVLFVIFALILFGTTQASGAWRCGELASSRGAQHVARTPPFPLHLYTPHPLHTPRVCPPPALPCPCALLQSYTTLGDLRSLYSGQLIVASVCLGALLFQCAWTVSSMRAVNREGREW